MSEREGRESCDLGTRVLNPSHGAKLPILRPTFRTQNFESRILEGEYLGGKILWVKFSEGSKERENHASASGELVSILHPLSWKCAQCSAGAFSGGLASGWNTHHI